MFSTFLPMALISNNRKRIGTCAIHCQIVTSTQKLPRAHTKII